jgi:inorganic pyrophosphatase
MGGLQVVDHQEADDKIISVLLNDAIWSSVDDVADLPEILVERLRHYFATYKMLPGSSSQLTVEATYGREHAFRVIEASIEDYREAYPEP